MRRLSSAESKRKIQEGESKFEIKMHFRFRPLFSRAELNRVAGMAPVLHDEPRSHSFELKLYNATTEPIEFQLAATSSFRLKAGSPTTESLSVSSHVVVTTSSFSNVVEFTVDGIPYQINSPSSGGKGWIALDRESTRSKLLLPIEGRGLSTNEKSVVKDPEFFVYQVNEVRPRACAFLPSDSVLN